MLQSSRKRGNIGSFKDRVKHIEEVSRNIEAEIRRYLESAKGRLYITYSRLGILPANVLYWIISTISPSTDIRIMDAMSYSYFVAAYTEPSTILYFTTDPGSNITLSLLQAASLTGNNVLLVTIKPRNEILADLLSPYEKITVDLHDEIEASLSMSIASFIAGVKTYKGLGRRHDRLEKHVDEGFSPIVEELLEKYSDLIKKVIETRKIIVTSSKILEPSALVISEALRRKGISSEYEPIEYVMGPGDVLVISSTVEEHYIREKIFRLRMTNAKIYQLVFNTDPLETNIYASIIGLYIAGIER